MKNSVIYLFGLAVFLVSNPLSHGQDPNQRAIQGLLKPRTRAMAIMVSPDQLKGVVPGSLVDVLDAVQKDKEKAPKVIVDKVKVLAIDLSPIKPNNELIVTATLEVTANQALALAAAAEEIPIHLPHLKLYQVFAALAYYLGHRDERYCQ